MAGALEAWLFGYVGTKVADKILKIFRSDQLINDLHSAIESWAEELPSNISLESSYALFPSSLSYNDISDRKSLNVIRSKLNDSIIPDQENWIKALMEQWEFVLNNIDNPQSFFLVEESEALKHITKLSECLGQVCAKHEELFKVTAINLLKEIAETTGVKPDNLNHVIDNIMCDARYRIFELAKEKLDVLTSIDSLDSDVRNILTALSIKVNRTKVTTPSDKQLLIRLRDNSAISEEVIDVVTSILLDLESRNQPEIARERYSDLVRKSPYIEEAFFEFLANIDEIKFKFESSRKYDLSEQELTGLTRGAFRNKDFELAVNIGTFLNASYPSTNAKTLLLYCESCLIVTNNQSQHYLLLDREVINDIDRLINQLISIIQAEDVRHIMTLMNLLNITSFSHRRLIDLGTKYTDGISKVDAGFAQHLLKLTSYAPEQRSRYELPVSILDLENYSSLNAAIQDNRISNFSVKKWLSNGGEIKTGDEYIDSFLELNLKARVCDKEDKSLISEVKIDAEQFLKSYANRLNELYPITVMDLSESFLELDLPLCAVEFLGVLLPQSPWLSPVFNCYLNALLASEKYEQLKNNLDSIVFEEKLSSTWLIETQLYFRLKNYGKAITAVKNAINLNADNAYQWFFLLSASRLNGTSSECLKIIVLDEIPSMIFETYCDSKLPLINEISTHVDPHIAERILVDWFVQNPEVLAIPLTQIHFSSLLNRAEASNNPYVPNHCCDGVMYSDGYTTRNKLLVRNINSSHSTLLDVESPLGQTLEEMEVGDVTESPWGEIRLTERLPSYVAAFRLAMELREAKNDGTDNGFRRFNLPSNEEDWLPCLENILKSFSSKDTKQNKALQNPNIPLMMKGHFTNPNEPLKGAVKHLTTPDSTKYLQLFDKGIDQPSRVVIDVYTATYLALTGVASTLAKSSITVVLTELSKLSLEQWINDVQREDYMSLSYTENGIHRSTSEDIKRDSTEFINELKSLIKVAEIEALTPFDTPEELIKIRNFFDQTVYTTFQLSIANEIPWLCIDHHISHLSHKLEHLVVNINSVVTTLLQTIPFKSRKQAISLNLLAGTPVPIMYNDILALSSSSASSDEFLVHKFMEKISIEATPFNSSDIALSFLTEVIGRVTANAYIDGQILRGGRAQNPAYDGYAEHIFNHCCLVAIKCLKGETAEFRFALFVFNILNSFGRGINDYKSLILNLASSFATGHFLDINEVNEVVKALHIERCDVLTPLEAV